MLFLFVFACLFLFFLFCARIDYMIFVFFCLLFVVCCLFVFFNVLLFGTYRYLIHTHTHSKFKDGDIGPLYSGLFAKLWQTVLNSAIKYMIYERVLQLVLILLRRMRKIVFMSAFARAASK